MSAILGIGECMVELSPRPNDLMAKGYAGDVLNTLWYARAALGDEVSVAFHSGFGIDQVSLDMKSFIEAAGIVCDGSPIISSRVPGLYMIHLNGAERSFSYWRDKSAARMTLQNPDLLWSRVAESDLIYLSGITLAILPSDDLKTLLSELPKRKKQGAKIAFDPNIRPRLWDDRTRMMQAISDMASISDIVLPSFDDEQENFGDATPKDTALRYAALGAELVVVKNGDAPTLVLQRGEFVEFAVPEITGIVDTTAAGDSFNGGFIASFMSSKDIEIAVVSAQECAGKVVCNHGALVSFDVLKD